MTKSGYLLKYIDLEDDAADEPIVVIASTTTLDVLKPRIDTIVNAFLDERKSDEYEIKLGDYTASEDLSKREGGGLKKLIGQYDVLIDGVTIAAFVQVFEVNVEMM